MTDQEFETWYKHFRGLFPGIDAWLAKKPATARNPDDLTQVDILRGWRIVLRDCELADAKFASEMLARGDLDEPRSFDSFPRVIRKAARGRQNKREGSEELKANRPRYVDGEQVYRCLLCLDRGTVFIVHPETIAAARRERAKGIELTKLPSGAWSQALYRLGTSCNCEAAPRGRYNEFVLDFNPESMISTDKHPSGEFKSIDETWREIIAFIDSGKRYYVPQTEMQVIEF